MSTADSRLRMATFNIHHGVGEQGDLAIARTAEVIAAMDVDVIGLQEVDRFWAQRSAFADQAVELAERLGMRMAFGASLRRGGEDRGPRREYGVALLSRHPVQDAQNTLLPRPRRGEQRTLLDATIDIGGGVLRCLTTHLQHRSRTERKAQAEAISAVVGSESVPTVLMGDLNARPEAPEVQALTAHLVDTWALRGEGDGHTFRASKPVARIDYVLASPGIGVEHARVVSTDASDHLPLTVGLRLPAPA